MPQSSRLNRLRQTVLKGVRLRPALVGSIPHTKAERDLLLLKLTDKKINNAAFKGGPLSHADRFMQYEKPAARAQLRSPEEPAQVFECKVGRNYHVRINGHLYSFPYKYIELSVTVKYTDSDVSIYSEGTETTHHARSFADGLTTLTEHMPENHRQYRSSLSRYKTDEELLKRAAKVRRRLCGHAGGGGFLGFGRYCCRSPVLKNTAAVQDPAYPAPWCLLPQ